MHFAYEISLKSIESELEWQKDYEQKMIKWETEKKTLVTTKLIHTCAQLVAATDRYYTNTHYDYSRSPNATSNNKNNDDVHLMRIENSRNNNNTECEATAKKCREERTNVAIESEPGDEVVWWHQTAGSCVASK